MIIIFPRFYQIFGDFLPEIAEKWRISAVFSRKICQKTAFFVFFMVEMSVWGWVEYNICIKTNDNYNGKLYIIIILHVELFYYKKILTVCFY